MYTSSCFLSQTVAGYSPRGKKSLLSISFLAATIAFFTANREAQLEHIGGSPIATGKKHVLFIRKTIAGRHGRH